MDAQLVDHHSKATLLGIVSSPSTANCSLSAWHHSSLPLSAQHPRQEYSVSGKESSTPNLRRFTGPLTHQTSPLTAPNITSFNHPIPLILVPDLTTLITRPDPYSISGGACGDIYKCVYHGPDGDVEVAVKAIRPHFIDDKVFRRELGIWKRLRHRNILELMGTTQHFSRSVALVAPWIVNGNLSSFLGQNNEILGPRDRLLLLRDITAGLNYLHTFSFTVDGHTYFNPVIHGDLTGNNILISSDRTACIADFGLSGTLTRLPGMTYLAMMNGHPGALRWSAPELFSAEESAAVVTIQSDIYSFGSVMLQVLTGNLPWCHLTREFQMYQVIFHRKKHPRPADGRIIDQHWNFITSCWSNAPIDRPSAEEALQFIDDELVLYDRGSVDGGQHPTLVPVPGYTPPVIGSVGQRPSSTPSPSPPSMRSTQICAQPLQPVRLLPHLPLHPLQLLQPVRLLLHLLFHPLQLLQHVRLLLYPLLYPLQLRQPFRLLLHLPLYPLKHIRNQQYGTIQDDIE
ncbi:kinase-like domain-containing protein [Suillus subalutaceus]|uniref:kinase-like domain-containing protein n=1 Tax=Suillus subalutaceus TaxID=48586 RepID=UPI001B87FBF1|nr:kinase-like domain-containing protein [Suillus subalutaceus]KAG1870681.1 kinase-like domain-containing protein [Suillus subalutaceus]